MRIVAHYSFNNGESVVKEKYPHLLAELERAIGGIDASKHKTKESEEKTMLGQLLYSPKSLNVAFKDALLPNGWRAVKEMCDYPTDCYVGGYVPPKKFAGRLPFREMDFVKEKLGVEVQFGKYSFMVYNVAAKMTIFSNLKHIDAGIEVVPVKEFAEEMSTGVSYFEQFVWDLKKRGNADIDVPVYILGIMADEHPEVDSAGPGAPGGKGQGVFDDLSGDA